MITGDNPLTAAHVARDVEIVDRDVLILDLKENPEHDAGKHFRHFSSPNTWPNFCITRSRMAHC
jgi:magnesium-transporting ATPase (P-type)